MGYKPRYLYWRFLCCLTLKGHSYWIWRLNFSPDGSTIATGCSSDHTIRLWNASTGECIRILSAHQDWIWATIFSPDGKTLASCSNDGAIKFWDVTTGNCLKTLQVEANTWVMSLAFSPDGRMLISGDTNAIIQVWNTKTFERIQTLRAERLYARNEYLWRHRFNRSTKTDFICSWGS